MTGVPAVLRARCGVHARRPWTGWLAVLVLAAVMAALCHPALADWRDDVKVLRVGFLASDAPASDAARLEPFRAYIETRIGLPVELVPATTWAALIDAETSARVQYGIFSATSYAAAAASCECIEPLALPTAFDGSRGFYSVLVARADGPITSLASADGARLALSGEDSVAGRLLPLKGFAANGIDPATYFSAIVKEDSPAVAISALTAGTVDLAAAWSSLDGDPAAGYSFGTLAEMVRTGSLAMDQVRVVWQSDLVPFGPHAVRKDLPEELKTLLLSALTGMGAEAPDALDAVDTSGIGGGGFVAATPADYDSVTALVARSGN
jgi:phosphonate transport system substrate-binding protein